jgi:hypothetical protein
MVSWHPKTCRLCGATREKVVIGKRGLCRACARANVLATVDAVVGALDAAISANPPKARPPRPRTRRGTSTGR